ncbi:MAG TPA: potassium channel family protein [Stellaceae bacterium]|nr:potassium channel family protein [Stellaceae bacterium]
MIYAMMAVTVMVILTILLHYEVLRFTSQHIADLPVSPRARIIVVVCAAFAAHTGAVWLYAAAYWVLVVHLGMGGFSGATTGGFQDCLYFSAITYTSLGLGDIFPTSHARLLAGVESLNGLVLIGWSASFTYLVMERYWPLHAPRHHR